MKIGYARVSTQDQELGRQIESLKKVGCEKIFRDKISGSKSSRPQLNEMLEMLKPGDVVYVQKLDRLGRSLKHLINIVDGFRENGIGFVSLSDGFDTTTSNGKLLFNIVGAIAEFERELIKERVKNGINFKRKSEEYVSGEKKWGRPLVYKKDGMTHDELVEEVMNGWRSDYSVKYIAETLGISRPTVYKIISEYSDNVMKSF